MLRSGDAFIDEPFTIAPPLFVLIIAGSRWYLFHFGRIGWWNGVGYGVFTPSVGIQKKLFLGE